MSLVEQTTEGYSDRRAIGTEVRYFGEALSMFTQMDYDINFNEIPITAEYIPTPASVDSRMRQLTVTRYGRPYCRNLEIGFSLN